MKWSLLLFSIRFIFVDQEINHRPQPLFSYWEILRISDLDASFDSMKGYEVWKMPLGHMLDHLAIELQYQVGLCIPWIISENWNPLLSILLHHYSTVSSGNILNLFLFTRIFFPKIVKYKSVFSSFQFVWSPLSVDQMIRWEGHWTVPPQRREGKYSKIRRFPTGLCRDDVWG